MKTSIGDVIYLQHEDASVRDAIPGVVEGVYSNGIEVSVPDAPMLQGDVMVLHRSVIDDARYVAEVEVESVSHDHCVIRLTGDFRRLQQRRFMRVDVYGIKVEVARREPNGRNLSERQKRLQRLSKTGVELQNGAHLVDLSAGGLRFESSEPYEAGETLDLRFALRDVGTISVHGQVTRTIPASHGRRSRSESAVSFSDVDESVRVKIMTWVVAEQSRRLRNEKQRSA